MWASGQAWRSVWYKALNSADPREETSGRPTPQITLVAGKSSSIVDSMLLFHTSSNHRRIIIAASGFGISDGSDGSDGSWTLQLHAFESTLARSMPDLTVCPRSRVELNFRNQLAQNMRRSRPCLLPTKKSFDASIKRSGTNASSTS